MNKEIEEKLDEIINYIIESNSYKNYLKAKDLINVREDLKEKINKIKKMQKEIVKNTSQKDELQNEYDNLLKELNDDITYYQYNKYLREVNNMLAIFENKVNKYFEDIFN